MRIDREGHVAEAVMTRAAKHNGLDWAMFEALNEAIDLLAAATEVRCVVLRGEGASFCAGLDFKSFIGGEGPGSPEAGFARDRRSDANLAQRVAWGWAELPVPVIACVQGACLGGGLQIALAADLRIAAPDARLAVMEARYGLVPDMSLSQTLPRLVRADLARELAYTARDVDAAEALELGLVTRVEADPLAAARALAAEIAARSPEAVRAAKRLLRESWAAGPAAALALEEELQRALLGSPNQLEAVRATLSGEPPRFAEPPAAGS